MVIKGPLIKAGSRFNRFNPIGNTVPRVTAINTFTAITLPATKDTQRSSGGDHIIDKVVKAKPNPIAVPKIGRASCRERV